MKTNILSSIVLVVIISLGIYFRFFQKMDNSFGSTACTDTLENLTNKSSVELTNNFEFLDGNTELRTLDGQKVILSQLITNNKLIFRYSMLHCSTCVYDELKKLDKLYKNGRDNILIIAYYENLRSLLIDYKTNEYTVPIYILPQNHLLGSLDKLDAPQYLLVNSDLLINHVFIPGISTTQDEIFLDMALKFLSI